MKDLNQIAEDLFAKIRGRFPSVTIGDLDGNVTNEPSEARFFEFDFSEGNEALGKVSVSLSEDDGITIMYGPDVVESAEDVLKDKWFNFLRELRTFSKKRSMNFKPQDITRSNLEKRDYKYLAQRNGEDTMTESKMYGTSRTSFQNIGNARIAIKHKGAVNTESATGRTQQIDAIFIESAEGERFKYPFKHLNGARAMARHVSEGGAPFDTFGKHITSLSEEMSKLRKFKTYMSRSSVMAESLAGYMDVVKERLASVKKEVEHLQRENYYKEAVESYQEAVLEDVPSDVAENWIDQLTIRQFNEELKDVFPYIYNLVSEATKSVELGPDDLFGESVNEADTIDYIGRKLRVKTTKGSPNPKNAPKWATAVGQTPEGAWHWLQKAGPVETPDSDSYFPKSGRTEFTGFESEAKFGGKVWNLNKKVEEDRADDIYGAAAGNNSFFQDLKNFFSGQWLAPLNAQTKAGVNYLRKRGFEDDEIRILRNAIYHAIGDFVNKNDSIDNLEDVTADNSNFIGWSLPIDHSLNDVDKGSTKVWQKEIAPVVMSYIRKKYKEKELFGNNVEENECDCEDPANENQVPLSEFILSYYDRETGEFPKGETAVLTMVEKQYGESAINPAKMFIYRVNSVFDEHQMRNNPQQFEDEELSRVRELAGIKEVSPMNPDMMQFINLIKKHGLTQQKNPKKGNYTLTGNVAADFAGFDKLSPQDQLEFSDIYDKRFAKQQQDDANISSGPSNDDVYPKDRFGRIRGRAD